MRTPAAAAVLALLLAVTGCGAFFQCEGKTDCGTSTSVPVVNSGDFVYVTNNSTNDNYLNGYSLSGGTLTALTGSPYNLDYVPQAIVIDPNNGFMYIATDPTFNGDIGYLYGYSISSTGVPTILNSGTALATENIAAMAISPNGEWLFTLDTNGLTVGEYQINTSTGLLTTATPVTYTGASGATAAPSGIAVAPTADFVVLALGQGGIVTFPFNETTGDTGPGQSLSTPSSLSIGVAGVTVDSNNNIYAVTTSGLEVFSSTTAGVLSSTPYSTSSTGITPESVVLSKTSYVYTANEGSGTVSGFTVSTSNPLVSLAGSPYTAPPDVDSIGIDNSGNYVVAAGFSGSGGLQVYSIGSGGALSPVSSQPTSTTIVPTVVALTH